MPPRIGLIVLGAAAVLFLLVVVFAIEREPDPEEVRADAQTVTVDLPQVAMSGMFGTATLEELEDGRTRVRVEVVQPPAGDQPARITEGNCAAPSESVHELEPVRGTPDREEPGLSETVLEVSFDELLDAGYVLEVDQLTGEDELALCGPLARA